MDVETSKAIQEVCSPAAGVFVHELVAGQTVALGERIAQIMAPTSAVQGDLSARVVGELMHQDAPPRAEQPVARLSREAAELASRHGLEAAVFGSGLITRADVLSFLRTKRLSPIPAHKRIEHQLLTHGAGHTMLSLLGIDVPGGPISRPGAGFFENKLLDLVVWEASRLMPEHPKLNAAFHEEGIEFHETVTAGVAFDGGGRLVVYGIEHSDRLSLAELQSQILAGLKRYALETLRAPELTRATFTVTDLSGTQVNFILPLLPAGQSSVIAIAAAPGLACRLYLGFDHRITEGLDAAQFLRKLSVKVAAALI